MSLASGDVMPRPLAASGIGPPPCAAAAPDRAVRMPVRTAAALLAGLLTAGVLHAATAGADRRREARDAAQVILDTHLFTDGRGIHIVPRIFTFYERIAGSEIPEELIPGLEYRFGFNMDGRRAIGLFGLNVQGSKVGVLGCVGCHSGRAAGKLYVGLGNKNMDTGMVGRLVQKFAKPYQWTRHLRPEHEQRLIDQAMTFTQVLADPRLINHTQGLVPVTLVWQWFYRQGGVPLPEKPLRGQVKIAHWWGYGEKRKVGLFSDGLGDGTKAGWAAAVELSAGQHAETVRQYYPRLEALEHLIEKLLPPAYPYEIDHPRAARGQEIFVETCSRCHGTYQRDAEGLPIYEAPRHVPLSVVGTDPDRTRSASPLFRQLVAWSPLSDLMGATDHPEGYFSPRLNGIWARFPYLHNNSVPSVRALLTPPEQRPGVWSLKDAGETSRFDPLRLGLTTPRPGSADEQRLLRRAQKGARDVYWTSREGHSNQGHPFGTTLPDADKSALIEYLKTL